MATRRNRKFAQSAKMDLLGIRLLQVAVEVEKLNQAVDDLGKILMMQTSYNESISAALKRFSAFLAGQEIEPQGRIQ